MRSSIWSSYFLYKRCIGVFFRGSWKFHWWIHHAYWSRKHIHRTALRQPNGRSIPWSLKVWLISILGLVLFVGPKNIYLHWFMGPYKWPKIIGWLGLFHPYKWSYKPTYNWLVGFSLFLGGVICSKEMRQFLSSSMSCWGTGRCG